MFDVCAGVGPFVVPASMLGCQVFANDINPECFKWLHVNLKKNQPKKSPREYQVFNLDGREFLQTIVFPNIERIQQEINQYKIVILMNLPALAITFFDVISQWLSINSDDKQKWKIPVEIYCYTFSREENREDDVRQRLNSIAPNLKSEQISCRFVRQVAPNKDMMCVQVNLFNENSNHQSDDDKEKNIKRFKKD